MAVRTTEPDEARLDVLRQQGWVTVPGVMTPSHATGLAAACERIGGQFRDKAAGGTRRLVDLGSIPIDRQAQR